MPNIKSAKKRLRTSEAARQGNVAARTRVKTARRTFIAVSEESDKKAADAAFKAYCSVLDKAAKKGVIKKNTATRRKSRAAEKLRTIK